MKKKLFYKHISLLTLLLFSLFIFNSSFAQLTAPIKRPFMWAPKDEGDKEIENFKSLKLADMSKNAGLDDDELLNDEIFLGNFWGMIKYFDTKYGYDFVYLHVYLGINNSDQIVLIFEPSKSQFQSPASVYYHLPEKFNPDNIDKFELKSTDKEAWVEKYKRAMALNTIDRKKYFNQYPNDTAIPHEPSDTRSVTYCVKDLKELIKAKDYYIANGHDINNSIIASLGCYSEAGDPREKNEPGKYANRIVIQFDFVDSKGSKFYLDNIKEFKSLPPLTDDSKCGFYIKSKKGNKIYKSKKKVKAKFNKVDNGQLCPTNCP